MRLRRGASCRIQSHSVRTNRPGGYVERPGNKHNKMGSTIPRSRRTLYRHLVVLLLVLRAAIAFSLLVLRTTLLFARPSRPRRRAIAPE